MTISFLGAGNMGEAILAGALRSGVSPSEVTVCEKRPDRAAELAAAHGVTVVSTLAEAATADTILLAVKPQDVPTVLDQLSSHLNAGQLLVSIAAGITTAYIESKVPAGVAVVRVMPNTPALVGEGMAALSAGAAASAADLDRASALMATTGRVVVVPESQQDAVTALSGSGPAYFFYLVESMISAGVDLGVSREVATELVVQTISGAAKLLKETGEDAAVLRQRVTSPGGTTAAAIAAFDDRDTRGAVVSAVRAAHDRSVELAPSGD